MNYLYRFNAAGLRANISFRNEDSDSDEDSEVLLALDQHLQQYFETLHDKAVQAQFRYGEYTSIDQLEAKLMKYDTTQGKPAGKKAAARKPVDESHEQSSPVVAKINRGGEQSSGNQNLGKSGGDGTRYNNREPERPRTDNRPSCEHCGKPGHSKDACFELQQCITKSTLP